MSRTAHRRPAKHTAAPLVSRSKARSVLVEWLPGPQTPSLEHTRHGEPRFTIAAEEATRELCEQAGIAFGGRSQLGIGHGYQASIYPDSIWIEGTPSAAMRALRRRLSALLGPSGKTPNDPLGTRGGA